MTIKIDRDQARFYHVGDPANPGLSASAIAALSDVKNGDIVYNTDTGKMQMVEGSTWKSVTTSTPATSGHTAITKAETLSLGESSTPLLTLSANTSGSITITGSAHTITTYSSGATGGLTTINGGTAGDIVMLFPDSTYYASRVVNVKKRTGSGNIDIYGDCILQYTYSSLTLRYNGTYWVEISRSPITYAP